MGMSEINTEEELREAEVDLVEDPKFDVVLDKENKIQLRYASMIFEPEVGSNSQNPPLKLAYTIVEKEVKKITFKYNLTKWKLMYAMRVDSTKNHCSYGGSPAVYLQMPYATYNLEDARDNLISYCTELMILLHTEYAVLYFDAKNAYGITCNFDEDGNRKEPWKQFVIRKMQEEGYT